MPDEMKFQMKKTTNERQDKFIYYITGLNIASVGFTLSKSFDLVFEKKIDLLVVIAITFWMVSIIASFRWIFIQNRIMSRDLELYDLKHENNSRHEIIEKHIKHLISHLERLNADDKSKCEKAMNWTIFFFIFGMVAFLAWRVFVIIKIL